MSPLLRAAASRGRRLLSSAVDIGGVENSTEGWAPRRFIARLSTQEMIVRASFNGPVSSSEAAAIPGIVTFDDAEHRRGRDLRGLAGCVQGSAEQEIRTAGGASIPAAAGAESEAALPATPVRSKRAPVPLASKT